MPKASKNNPIPPYINNITKIIYFSLKYKTF